MSQADIATRYGLFLGFLGINRVLDLKAPAATQVTPKNIEAYMADLKDRVNSVTAWNCIYKVRLAAQLIGTWRGLLLAS